MTMPFADLYWRSDDGLRLYARDYRSADGAQLPVICIPGLTRNSADFGELAQWLCERGRRVLALDLRGRGRSERDPVPQRYRVPTYAADVLALMRAEKIPRAVFIGTSLGVLVTMAVASSRSEAVAAAVLNDAGPQVGREALARIRAYAGKPVAPMTRADAVAYAKRLGAVAFPNYGDDDWRAMATRMLREREDGLFEPDYDPKIARTASPFLLWLVRPLMWRAFKHLARGRPTLLLRGSLSDVLEPELVARMARAAPSMQVVEVPGVGHAPDLSEPTARAAIDALLRVAASA
jgi:pimeloyl-ACP methyl ester carboxylesterase